MRVTRLAATAVMALSLAVVAACGTLPPPGDATVADNVSPAVDAPFEAVPGNPPRPWPPLPAPAAALQITAASARLALHISQAYRIDAGHATRIVNDCFRLAQAAHLHPTLLLAVIARESSFRSDAVSAIGAVGLMQIRPELHDRRRDRLGLSGALTDPEVNIAVGADLLRECLFRNRGDLARALVDYSGGATNYSLKVARLELDFLRFAQR
jgi:soluble lytic murein transglycosylase-like protein